MKSSCCILQSIRRSLRRCSSSGSSCRICATAKLLHRCNCCSAVVKRNCARPVSRSPWAAEKAKWPDGPWETSKETGKSQIGEDRRRRKRRAWIHWDKNSHELIFCIFTVTKKIDIKSELGGRWDGVGGGEEQELSKKILSPRHQLPERAR